MDEYNLSITIREEVESRYGLKADFYRAHKFRRYDWDGTSRMTAYKPIAFIRRESLSAEYIRVQYRDGWYALIEHGNSMNGPHPVKLYVKLPGYDESIWLGTCQFEGNFYNDKLLRKQLRRAILRKVYYASDPSDEEEFVMVTSEVQEMELGAQLPLSTCFQKFRVLRLPKSPICPKCHIKKRTFKGLKGHYLRVHGKLLLFSYSKPIDKCPPL